MHSFFTANFNAYTVNELRLIYHDNNEYILSLENFLNLRIGHAIFSELPVDREQVAENKMSYYYALKMKREKENRTRSSSEFPTFLVWDLMPPLPPLGVENVKIREKI